MKKLWIIVLISLVTQGALSIGAAQSEEHIALLPWDAPKAGVREEFQIDASNKEQVWNQGPPRWARVYFHEWLPAIFERTLVLDQFSGADGDLEWIFTGPRAGFTIRIEGDRVRVSQRFYDSIKPRPKEALGLNNLRHSEQKGLESTVSFTGPLRGITVVMDHRLGLSVQMNGQEVAHQEHKR